MENREDETNERVVHTALRTDVDLHRALAYLLKQAHQPQIWLFFLSHDFRLMEPIVPMNEYPASPTELLEVPDLGLVTFPYLFARRAQSIADTIGAGSFAIVWEREGSDRFTSDDIAWASAFVDSCGRLSDGVALRAVFLLHDTGLRQFAPDDYG